MAADRSTPPVIGAVAGRARVLAVLRIDMALSSLSHAVVPGGAGTLRHLPEPTVLQIPTVARDPAERLDLFAILH